MKDLFSQEQLAEWFSLLSGRLMTDGLAILLLLVFLKIGLWIFKSAITRLAATRKKVLKKTSPESEAAISKRMDTLFGIVHQSGRVAIYTVFFLTILTHVGVEIGPILASVGVVGLALGFGSQELVRDMVSGLFNLVENNIRIGDVMTINGTSGVVEKVELRTTVLRDYTGTVHVFQNGKIRSLSNMTKDWSAASFNVEVSYKENVVKVIEVMIQVSKELQENSEFGPDIQEPIEVAGLDNYGQSALVIKARIKTKPGQQWTVGREFRKNLKEAFDKEGIEIRGEKDE